MKIGIDVRSMFGTPAGVGRITYNLLTHMSKLDQENEYWLYADCEVDPPIIQQPNFHQKSLTLPFAQNYFTWNHFRLPPELLRHPVDLFHFPFYTIPLIRNYKSVVTIHDITYEIHPEWFSRKGLIATRYFSKYAAKHADKVFTDSYYSKQDLITYYGVPENKVVVAYPAVEEWFKRVDDSDLFERTKARFQITAAQVILYVGSIHTRRNIEQLIRAFHRLCQNMSDVQLVLVGRNEYPYLDVPGLINELELHNRVISAGYIHFHDEALLALYNIADLFMYPSSYEGFGIPPLEALACETPVITVNKTSVPEVVGEAAVFVDPLNIEEEADAMYQVLNDEVLQRDMIMKGIAQADKFSWEHTARRTLQTYQDVMK